MRFAIYSVYGCDLAFAARLQDEGHDVLLHTDGKTKDERHAGEGLVPKCDNLSTWLAWGRKDKDTVHVFTGSGAGKLADKIRQAGGLVLGGGEFMDKLEEKRADAEKLVASLGMTVPPHEEFPDIPSARARAKTLDGEWVFKTDKYLKASATYLATSAEDMVRYLDGLEKEFGRGGRCLLQRKIPGTAISTAAWFNGKTFIAPFEGTIEHKKFLNDDLGPNTGCSFNVVWMYRDYPEIARALQWGALDSYLRHKRAPAGLYDINALIGEDGKAYFLEFTPRFGYDSEPTAMKLLTTGLGEFYYKLVTGQLAYAPFSTEEIAYSVRISVPPYPGEENLAMHGKGSSMGVSVLNADGLWANYFVGYGVRATNEGDLEVASPAGLIGLAATKDRTLQGAHDTVMKYLKEGLQVPNLQYRTDGVQRIEEDLKALAKTEFAVKEVRIK